MPAADRKSLFFGSEAVEPKPPIRSATPVASRIRLTKNPTSTIPWILLFGLCSSFLCGAQPSASDPLSPLVSMPAEGYTSTSAPCGYIELSEPIFASASGAWKFTEGQAELTFVDTYREDLLTVEPKGSLLSAKGSPPSKDALARAAPSRIRSHGGYLVLQDDKNQELLDLSFGPSALDRFSYAGPLLPPLDSGTDETSGEILRLYGWTLLAPDPTDREASPGFTGMVDFRLPDQKEIIAFVTFDERMAGRVVRKYEDVNDPIFYRSTYFDYPYFASVGNKAYVLFLEEKRVLLGEISRDSIEPRWLDEFPASLGQIAEVVRDEKKRKAGLGPELATRSLQNFERSESLAGIYGLGDRLFVLFKEPMAQDGTTEWWLYELSTDSGETIARYPVPSQAAHLTAVPGPTWAFLEKGAVAPLPPTNAPFRDILSLVTVPMDRFGELRQGTSDLCVGLHEPTKDQPGFAVALLDQLR